MPTLKQHYNIITKRIWNPRVYNYQKNFKASIVRCKDLGLTYNQNFSINDFTFPQSDKEQITDYILKSVYNVSKYQLEDLTQKCFLVSHSLQSFLQKSLGIKSIVTTGNIYSHKMRINYEALKSLKRRLSDPSYMPPFKGHTWLTLENHDVIDLGFAPNMWLEKVSGGTIEPRENYQKIVWTDTEHKDRNALVYEPLIIGYNYFERIELPVRLRRF